MNRRNDQKSDAYVFINSEENHRFDVLMIVDPSDNYYGIVTYQRLLKYEKEEEIINRNVIQTTDTFWEDAKEYFKKYPDELLPVVDVEGNVLGFCYDEDDSKYDYMNFIKAFEEVDTIPVSLKEWNENCQQIWIQDLNEMAWRAYHIFKKIFYLFFTN